VKKGRGDEGRKVGYAGFFSLKKDIRMLNLQKEKKPFPRRRKKRRGGIKIRKEEEGFRSELISGSKEEQCPE